MIDVKRISFCFFLLSSETFLCENGAPSPKIIKQRCFIQDCSRGKGGFFFGLAIYRANILYRDLTVYNSRHPKQKAFWRDRSPTTYIIIVSGGSTIRPSCPWLGCLLIYVQSLLQFYDLNVLNVVIKTG
jgi:hypothetical protein